MNTQLASKMGKAFCLGVLYAKHKKLAFDEAKWITVKPNGSQHTGRPALIDSATGEVLGGMGGKFNGRHISAVKQGGKFEQPGAQMQIIARNSAQKAAAMNNQRIDFKPVGGQSQTDRSAIEAENANLNKQIKDLNKKIKTTSKYSPDFESLKQQKQALEEQRKVNANLLGAEKQRQQANEYNQKIKQQQAEKEARTKADSERRLQETIEKQAQAKEEFKNKRLTEITNIKKPNDQQFLYTPIADFKETSSDYQVINPTYTMAVEKLGAKEARGYDKYISIPKESATVIDGKIQAVTEEYRNKLKRALIEAGSAKQASKENGSNAGNLVTPVSNQQSISNVDPEKYGKVWEKNGQKRLYLDPKKMGLNLGYYKTGNIKDSDINGEVISHSEARKILGGAEKAYIDLNTGEIKGVDRSSKFYQTFGKKIEEIASSVPKTQTTAKQASKESVSASGVLGIPNASNWNRKIYTYKNGEKAVFINNKKIILNDEQYNKLKSLT